MNTGTAARLYRIGKNNKYVIVPIDHGLTQGAVDGLRDVESTVDAVTRGGVDAILSQKGIAQRVHQNKNDAGYIMHLSGSTDIGPDPADKRLTGTVEEAIKVGADAVSYHINVLSEYEGNQIEALAKITKDANEFGMPVLVMCYVRGHEEDMKDPRKISHAVRLGEELGGDIIKTVYTGDSKSFESVVTATSKPVVIAGGKKGTDKETIEMVKGAMDAGAAGVSMGRCIFQHKNPESISRAVVEIVHNGASVEKAMEKSGLLEK